MTTFIFLGAHICVWELPICDLTLLFMWTLLQKKNTKPPVLVCFGCCGSEESKHFVDLWCNNNGQLLFGTLNDFFFLFLFFPDNNSDGKQQLLIVFYPESPSQYNGLWQQNWGKKISVIWSTFSEAGKRGFLNCQMKCRTTIVIIALISWIMFLLVIVINPFTSIKQIICLCCLWYII